MSLVISLGTNIGNRSQNLKSATQKLCEFLVLKNSSNVYESTAVDYLDQPDFLNQVLEFDEPSKISKDALMEKILNVEKDLGRERVIDKGPRVIDIDILFWGTEKYNSHSLTIPHPRLFSRSFIVLPLSELDYFKILKTTFDFPSTFNNSAHKYIDKEKKDD